MRALPENVERILLFFGTAALWAFAYLGTAAWTAARPMGDLAWDPVRYVPPVSAFVIPYLSAYALPFIAAAVTSDRASYRKLAAVVAGTIVVCAAGFALWPLAIARPDVGSATIFDRLLSSLYGADRPTALFPSLHVAMSFLLAAAVGRARPRWRGWAMAWAALIAVSTLFIRQHYAIDVLGGAVVAWVAWRIFRTWTR